MLDILVIEDNEDIRLATLEFLEMEGFRAEGFENGRLGLDHLLTLKAEPPKLILIDLSMPVMGGQAFREAQVADPELRHIPCVVMSADGRIDANSPAFGMTAAIRKPVDLDELLTLVNKFVRA